MTDPTDITIAAVPGLCSVVLRPEQPLTGEQVRAELKRRIATLETELGVLRQTDFLLGRLPAAEPPDPPRYLDLSRAESRQIGNRGAR